MRIEFNTVEYEFSHGRKPRGRGSWAFFFARPRDNDEPFFTRSMTYVEAKREVVAEAKRRFGEKASGTIYVGS